MGQRFPRDHLIAHCGVVDEDGFNRGDLLKVRWLQALVGIHIGMVGPCLIVQRVLNKLEARDANGIKGQVVCAARVSVGYGGYAEISQRSDPLLEDVSTAALPWV